MGTSRARYISIQQYLSQFHSAQYREGMAAPVSCSSRFLDRCALYVSKCIIIVQLPAYYYSAHCSFVQWPMYMPVDNQMTGSPADVYKKNI
jgi:hypothetical protein